MEEVRRKVPRSIWARSMLSMGLILRVMLVVTVILFKCCAWPLISSVESFPKGYMSAVRECTTELNPSPREFQVLNGGGRSYDDLGCSRLPIQQWNRGNSVGRQAQKTPTVASAFVQMPTIASVQVISLGSIWWKIVALYMQIIVSLGMVSKARGQVKRYPYSNPRDRINMMPSCFMREMFKCHITGTASPRTVTSSGGSRAVMTTKNRFELMHCPPSILRFQ